MTLPPRPLLGPVNVANGVSRMAKLTATLNNNTNDRVEATATLKAVSAPLVAALSGPSDFPAASTIVLDASASVDPEGARARAPRRLPPAGGPPRPWLARAWPRCWVPSLTPPCLIASHRTTQTPAALRPWPLPGRACALTASLASQARAATWPATSGSSPALRLSRVLSTPSP